MSSPVNVLNIIPLLKLRRKLITSECCGLEVINLFFVRVKGDYYIPLYAVPLVKNMDAKEHLELVDFIEKMYWRYLRIPFAGKLIKDIVWFGGDELVHFLEFNKWLLKMDYDSVLLKSLLLANADLTSKQERVNQLLSFIGFMKNWTGSFITVHPFIDGVNPLVKYPVVDSLVELVTTKRELVNNGTPLLGHVFPLSAVVQVHREYMILNLDGGSPYSSSYLVCSVGE